MGEDLFGDDISGLWGAPGEAAIQPASPRRLPGNGQDERVGALEREVDRLRGALEELQAAAARGRDLDVLLEVVGELDRREAEAEADIERRLVDLETRLLARVGEVDSALQAVHGRVVSEAVREVESREERRTWGVLRELEATMNRQLSLVPEGRTQEMSTVADDAGDRPDDPPPAANGVDPGRNVIGGTLEEAGTPIV